MNVNIWLDICKMPLGSAAKMLLFKSIWSLWLPRLAPTFSIAISVQLHAQTTGILDHHRWHNCPLTSFWLFLTHFVSIWLNLTHFVSFWLILTHFVSFWLILTHFDSFWLIMTHFDSFWRILTHFWLILTHFDPYWLDLTKYQFGSIALALVDFNLVFISFVQFNFSREKPLNAFS